MSSQSLRRQDVRRLVLGASPEALAQLAKFARMAAADVGFDALQSDRIELVMDEACSNIIEHAYRHENGIIDARIDVACGRQITIYLVDKGDAFVPADVPEYCVEDAAEREKVGGLGLFLMRKVMDEVHFEFNVPGIGNRLTMIKRI